MNITLIDNDILEQMLETFTVCLDTTDSGVTLTSDTTTVTIVEDDGMPACCYHSLSVCIKGSVHVINICGCVGLA